MSKKYKVEHMEKDIINDENDSSNISKKELYDLQKQEKLKKKAKENKKKDKKKKNKKSTYKANLGARIFAITMLILMLGSVIATISYYFK